MRQVYLIQHLGEAIAWWLYARVSVVVERVRLGEPCLDSATEVDKTTLDGKWSGRGSPTSRWLRSDSRGQWDCNASARSQARFELLEKLGERVMFLASMIMQLHK